MSRTYLVARIEEIVVSDVISIRRSLERRLPISSRHQEVVRRAETHHGVILDVESIQQVVCPIEHLCSLGFIVKARNDKITVPISFHSLCHVLAADLPIVLPSRLLLLRQNVHQCRLIPVCEGEI